VTAKILDAKNAKVIQRGRIISLAPVLRQLGTDRKGVITVMLALLLPHGRVYRFRCGSRHVVPA
jgi:hypothetical protein